MFYGGVVEVDRNGIKSGFGGGTQDAGTKGDSATYAKGFNGVGQKPD